MGLINIKNLTFEYFRRDEEGNLEEMIEALKGVSLDVNQGEFIAIVGRNGSGKSTLAKHINALLLPSEGEIIVDGLDTAEEEVRLSVRKTAGMIFQNPDNQIVANLVEEDVAFGPENMGVPTPDIWNRVDESLTTVEMQEYGAHSPNLLSGGQKQRVAIAGVLAMEPKCIIFDEATSMLDPQGREQILFAARQLQKEKKITIIFITHHMDEVVWADRVFVMDKGRIVTHGTPRQIFKQPWVLSRCGLQLPVLYQYIDFLVNNRIVSNDELENVYGEEELIALLCHKYRREHERNENIENRKRLSETQTEAHSATEGILLNHVSYVYGKGFAQESLGLKNVSLQIGKGEFVAVIGETGSGKSTLMQHLNGLLLPQEGEIYFEGKDITDKDFSLKMLRQRVGLVFQNPDNQLFAESVERDVCFGPENMNISRVEAQKRAYEAIGMVGLPDTIYDMSPFQLSGGQKRRVAIAGVLAMKPDYLVLDEPTSGLDPVSARELLELLKRLQVEAGMTVVMVSHKLEEVAEFADRVVVMKQGRKLLDGAVKDVLSQVGALEQAGLLVPVGIKMLYALHREGVDVDVQMIRQEDILEQLLKLRRL
ncbi:MAG: energy-coupling factor transporter ATPase [Lachnospiraceae bacterium]|nr:energy-coupling factor transporter ATPase [Lachnospiraceae bacterium]